MIGQRVMKQQVYKNIQILQMIGTISLEVTQTKIQIVFMLFKNICSGKNKSKRKNKRQHKLNILDVYFQNVSKFFPTIVI